MPNKPITDTHDHSFVLIPHTPILPVCYRLQSIRQPSTTDQLFRLCSLLPDSQTLPKGCEEPHEEPKRTASLRDRNISKLGVPPSGVHSCCFPLFATQVQSCCFESLRQTQNSWSGHPGNLQKEKFTHQIFQQGFLFCVQFFLPMERT